MDPIVDAHAHFMPRGALRSAKAGTTWHGMRIEVAKPATPGVSRPKAHPASESERVFRRVPRYFEMPEERIESMDRAGVDRQIISLSPAMFRYDLDLTEALAYVREANDDLHGWATEWPERYGGIGIVPAQHIDAAIAELERCVRDLGMYGIIVDTHVNGEDWDSPRLLPLLQAAEALDALVFFHPGEQRVAELLPRYHFRNFIGNPFETTVAIGALIFGGVIDKVPNVRMMFAHGGGFACANVGRFDHGMQARAEAKGAKQLPSDYLRHLWFDQLTFNEHALRCLIEVAGPGQIVLGTDYPADMGEGRPTEWVMSCEHLTEGEKQAILRGNVDRLLGRRARS